MSKEQTAEEVFKKVFVDEQGLIRDSVIVNKYDILRAMEEYATLKLQEQSTALDYKDRLYNDLDIAFKEQAKEIEELTRSRDDVFHELEGCKEHINQLESEIESLKGTLKKYIQHVVNEESVDYLMYKNTELFTESEWILLQSLRPIN